MNTENKVYSANGIATLIKEYRDKNMNGAGFNFTGNAYKLYHGRNEELYGIMLNESITNMKWGIITRRKDIKDLYTNGVFVFHNVNNIGTDINVYDANSCIVDSFNIRDDLQGVALKSISSLKVQGLKRELARRLR